MDLKITEIQKDNLFGLINTVENADELACHLGVEKPKSRAKNMARLMQRREQDGGIWDIAQIGDLIEKEPEFYATLFDQSRYAFLNISQPSAVSYITAFPAITFGAFFQIKWGKWPKNWGDQRTHFAIEVHFKQMALQDRLDQAEKEIEQLKKNMKRAKEQPKGSARDRAIAGVEEAQKEAKVRIAAVEREIADVKKARKDGNHKRMAEIVIGNIKKKIAEVDRKIDLIKGDDKKAKAARDQLDKEKKGLFVDISNVNKDLEKLK